MVLLTLAMQSLRFGGGSFFDDLPNNRFMAAALDHPPVTDSVCKLVINLAAFESARANAEKSGNR